jgi:hypothetical protein
MSDAHCSLLKASAFCFLLVFVKLNKKGQLILKFICGSLQRAHTTFQQLTLQFTCGILQWVYKPNLLTPQRTLHQAAWLYQVVVTREKVISAISKGGKDYTFLVVSNSFVMPTHSMRCVHVNTELGSKFQVWI